MARTDRVVIVGAGIIGTAVAFELSRRGADATVYDGRSLGGGATQASAGILAPFTEAHSDGALFDLTVRGLDAYDEFVRDVRATSTVGFEYRRAGTLEIAEDEGRATELRQRLAAPWTRTAGLEWADADALRALAPAVTRDAVGALRCSAHGHVAVPSFVAAIADAALKFGARIHLETPVTRVEMGSAGVVIHAPAGRLEFDRAVLCGGAWTPLLDPVGETRERIRPVRGQLLRLHSVDLDLHTVIWGRSCYVVPWEDGTLLVGATEEEVGFDERATAEGVRQLLTAAQALVPPLESATFLEVRVGLRPASAHRLPMLGPSRDPRIIYAAGHFRNGILLAPLTARLIAAYVLDGVIDPAF